MSLFSPAKKIDLFREVVQELDFCFGVCVNELRATQESSFDA